MGNIHTSGPNEALIISGGCCGGENAKRTVVGGWGWAWWCVSGKFDLILSTWKNVNMNIDQIARFYMLYRPVASGKAVGARAPHFLADQLTLSQPGGHIIPTQYYVPPPDFQTLRRPCYIPN